LRKVFVFIGSNHGKNSVTKEIVNLLKENISNISDIELDWNIYTSSDQVIIPCKGCNNCFIRGKCPLDKDDCMGTLKRDMLKSDLIIFASPVYLKHVSGSMKNFLDRIAYWTHLFPLAGKMGVPLVTSSGSGIQESIAYLSDIMTYFGLDIISGLGVASPKKENEIENTKNQIIRTSVHIIKYLKENDVAKSNLRLENTFQLMKRHYHELNNSGDNTEELKYWKKSGLFYLDTFQDFIDRSVE
jgi:multimeric flavodoxin WrbA